MARERWPILEGMCRLVPLVMLALLAGCEGRPFGRDGGALDAGPLPDTGPLPLESEPSPPPAIERPGIGGFLLRGTVLAPDRVIDPGEVLVVGPDIVCVSERCAGVPGAESVTVIRTNGIISPGLVDAHNHLTYDFLPEWVGGQLYGNRYRWSDVTSYEDHIRPFSDGRNLNERICPGAKWGELRSIIHGTTTVQGQSANRSCLDRLARNADHYHRLGHDHLRTTITSPRDITDEDAASLVASFTDPSAPTTRYAVHMCEGVAGDSIELEFDSFAGRDPRENRHAGISLLAAPDGAYRGTGLLIHSMILTDAQLMEARDTDAHVVWSPSSNLVLYGATAPIARMLELGLNVGLGPDWTLSGEDEMLSEMRVAHAYGQSEGIAALTPERVWQMATQGSADAVGLGDVIGALRVGTRADVAVFARRAVDPFRAVLDSRAEDVRLVLVDGLAYYGDLELEGAGANGRCDVLDACGRSKFLCVAGTPGSTADGAGADETLDDVRAQLLAILETYGRTDLLELIACR
jgi:cytosine/adenosine deaminase-related metal-dependent hydrolase